MGYILYKQHVHSLKRAIVATSVLLFILNCTPKTQQETTLAVVNVKIIPNPAKILYKRNNFFLHKSTRILLNLSDKKSKQAGEYLLKEIEKKTNYNLKIADIYTTSKIASGIEIITEQNQNTKPESFKIIITKSRIKIFANDRNGLYYAINTAIGLLKNNNSWAAAQLSIEDFPLTNYRGLYLNFNDSIKNQEELKELIKLNRINYLISSEKFIKTNGTLLHIGDTSLLPSNWMQNLINKKTIKSFYQNLSRSKEAAIFSITDSALLHPDSLAILGEAMWSQASKRDYQKIINHLKNKPID